MSKTCSGYEIVCPDGHVRRPPYHNHGDAACDARSISRRGCNKPNRSSVGSNLPPCPGGEHTVVLALLVHQETIRGQA